MTARSDPLKDWLVTLELELFDPSDEHNPDDPGSWSEVLEVMAEDEQHAVEDAIQLARARYLQDSSDANLFTNLIGVVPRA